MIIATKRSIQLHVKIEEDIKITPLAKALELLTTAKVIANSFRTILKYHISSNPKENKTDLVRNYFKSIGWQVEG